MLPSSGWDNKWPSHWPHDTCSLQKALPIRSFKGKKYKTTNVEVVSVRLSIGTND